MTVEQLLRTIPALEVVEWQAHWMLEAEEQRLRQGAAAGGTRTMGG